MATQFAINEPDSSNSPNAAYLLVRGGRAQGFNLHSPDDVVFGYGAIDFIGDHDYFDIPLPPSSFGGGGHNLLWYGHDQRHRE